MNVPETFFSVSEELWLLMLSGGAGALLGICWDFIRALRLIFPHNKLITAAEDLLFLVLYALFLSLFASGAARGHLRLYYVLGNALGAVLYFLTIGRAVMAMLRTFIAAVIKPLHIAFVLISKKVCPFFVYSHNLLVISVKKICFLLRNYTKVVYNRTENKKRRNVKRVGEKNKA